MERGWENPWKVSDWLTWHLQQWTRDLASNMVGGEDQHPSLSLDFHTWTMAHTHTQKQHVTYTQRSYKHTYVHVDESTCDRCFRKYQSPNYTVTITAWLHICLLLSRSDTGRFRELRSFAWGTQAGRAGFTGKRLFFFPTLNSAFVNYAVLISSSMWSVFRFLKNG